MTGALHRAATRLPPDVRTALQRAFDEERDPQARAHLESSLKNADSARSLSLGKMVTLNGRVFTGRSRFHIGAVEQNIAPPIDFPKINAFFHVGPVMRQAGDDWHPISAEPTSSIRFERYGPDMVRRLNLHTLIGKTTMGRAIADALRDVGGVFLSKIGLCGNQLAGQIKWVAGVHFLEELGKTEATWVFEVERLAPSSSPSMCMGTAISKIWNARWSNVFQPSNRPWNPRGISTDQRESASGRLCRMNRSPISRFADCSGTGFRRPA